MYRERLNELVELFTPVGEVTYRSMFGGFGLFCEQCMFAFCTEKELYFNATEELVSQFELLESSRYTYKKRGLPVVTNYFLNPHSLTKDPVKTLTLAKQALLSAKERKCRNLNKTDVRVKDLPNMKLSTERMLKKVGISNPQQLSGIGSVQAYLMICSKVNPTASVDLLWSFEGAIQGVHWATISDERRKELLTEAQAECRSKYFTLQPEIFAISKAVIGHVKQA